MAICPSCGRENPDGFAFCGYCATPLEGRPETPSVEERKVVSILFCDLVGFTAASDRQDPEDVRARLRPYHARLRREIERYGGTVEKFIGDAVMAVFGAPVAHEDDAERAVLAGLRILQAIGALNDADPSLDLQVRIGINTGEAVVARDAHPEQGEGIVSGDVVNTAARIQSVAPVNGIAVSEQTHRATERIFNYEPLPPVSVKGKAEPLALWQARARARFGTDITRRYDTPFIGRELEKALLIATFERAAQQRSVQLLTIVGEPGVGKSRLIGELLSYVDAKPDLTRWRQGRCLPYGEGIAFWALGEIVKAEAGILESDSAEVAAGKLESIVPWEELERQWLLQRLGPLVGVGSAVPAERQELFTAWRRFLEGLGAAYPTVLVFEDLHWADESLLAFLEHLTEWSHGVPLLVLCAARPELYERRPGWGAGQRNAQTIDLPPLSDLEAADLVKNLDGSGLLEPNLRNAVMERAEGNPLFAEELVRLVMDRSDDPGHELAKGTVLPGSVQALIAARLDTLSAERKALLQDAAVIGKVFWSGALAEIGERDADQVELALHELSRKEFVRPVRTSSMEGEREYSFWHLLIRDVAYGQIPRAERARRHRSAAAWIEGKAGERVEDLAEVLAHHYLQALQLAQAAGDGRLAEALLPRARGFLRLAGERALGLDTAQAEAQFARALELTPPTDPERPELVVRWADAAFQAGRPREAAEALDGLRGTLEDDVAARALQLRSRVTIALGEGRQIELATEAVRLLERQAPSSSLVAAYEQLANVRAIAGAWAEAIVAADRARGLALDLHLQEPARALGYRGYARANLGETDGLVEMGEAISLLTERGASLDAAVLRNNLAITRYALEGPGHALAAFEEGIRFCEQRGLGQSAALLEANCPGLLMELGRSSDAATRADRLAVAAEARGNLHSLTELRAVQLALRLAGGHWTGDEEAEWLIRTSRTIGVVDISVLALTTASAYLVTAAPERSRSVLAELHEGQGRRETPYYARALPTMVRTALAAHAPELAERLADALQLRYPLEEHALRAVRAQLAEDAGDLAEAATLYGEAAERWKAFGHVPERAYALLGRGRCLSALGDPEGASVLDEARHLFGEMGYRPALAEAEALLARSRAEQR